MAYPDKINALVDIAGTSTLSVVGHAARHNDVNDALDEVALTLPRGVVVRSQTLASTAIVASTTLVVISVSATIVPARMYRISGRCAAQLTATSTVILLSINESTLGVKTLQYQTEGLSSANLHISMAGQVTATATDFGVTTGSGTAKTIELRWFSGAAGTLATNPDGIPGANSTPQEILVEDIGPA
jgi:hypothetical protein